ncbi:3-dehydroquinate synthase [Actinomyces marmotae]|uniref:Multifunctional fusion protein n=1 Tax=Actinomyces marmotae TaxID=2737173 RepID=A0A6M8BAC0_9ACTO|nr:3-dehydroquinate synthase [Actinomyces marmotae]QKD79765.1 3-dehydroquinate synthase [Actinomyces marmotae]
MSHNRTDPAATAIINRERLPLVLVGLPGAGKTTVARLLAAALGIQVTDTDAEIRRRARMTIPEIFTAEGEEGFRDRETRALREVLESLGAAHGIVALGGGGVLRPENREMLRHHTVVYLSARPATAAQHVGSGEGRPLISPGSDSDAALTAVRACQGALTGVLARMEALDAERRPLYEEIATVTVPTDGLSPAQVAALVLVSLGATPAATARGLAHAGILSHAPARREPSPEVPAGPEPRRPAGPRVTEDPEGATTVHVPGARGYDVVIGRGLLAPRVTRAVLASPGQGAGGVGIIHPGVLAQAAGRLAGDLHAAGLRTALIEVPDGEASKRADVLSSIWEHLGRAGLGRDGCLIGVGGGATTDLAGFAAATWLRGIPVVQAPTTLLAMVDAAVGGKTGIDTAAGKNLVGAFHTPSAVVADLGILAGLPLDELRAGLGEVIKCGLIQDEEILRLVEADPAACLRSDAPVLAELVRRAVLVKAAVVAQDLTESGLREILNYGHTYGHAIERITDYTWRHGEAVAVGCVFAAEIAHRRGLLSGKGLARHREALEAVGLPVAFPDGAERWDDLRAAMRSDKKNRAGRLRMVLVEDRFGPLRPIRGVEPTPGELEAAHRAVTASPEGAA